MNTKEINKCKCKENSVSVKIDVVLLNRSDHVLIVLNWNT